MESEEDFVKTVQCRRVRKPSVVCYIGELRDLPGKFHPKKALELGVPRGPLFGELKQGNHVTLENGKVVSRILLFAFDFSFRP